MASIPSQVSADPSRLQPYFKVGRGGLLSVRYQPYPTTHMFSRFDKSAGKIVEQVEKLFQAVERGDLRLVKKLLNAKAPVDYHNEEGLTVLMKAAAGPYSPIVAALLEGRADPKRRNDAGKDALFFADKYQRSKAIKMLLPRIFQTPGTTGGKNILMVAAEGGHTFSVSVVLETNGPGVNDRDQEGWTALMYASSGGHPETAQALITAKADVNQSNRGWETALMIAAGRGCLPTVTTLLRNGAHIRTRDQDGRNAAAHAARNGHELILNFFIHCLGKLDSWTPDDRAALLVEAAAGGHTTLVKKLIQAGIEVNCKDWGGMTPLIMAAEQGKIETVELLLKRGAQINTVCLEDTTAFTAAATWKRDEVMRLLATFGANVNYGGGQALVCAVIDCHTEIVKVLLELRADPNLILERNPNRDSVLMYAARGGRVEIMRLLAASGANIKHQNRLGETAVDSAVITGDTEALKVLLELGVDINAADSRGTTALMRVIAQFKDLLWRGRDTSESIRKRTPAIRLLVKSGARVDANILKMLDSSLQDITAVLLENESTPRHAQDQSGRTLLVRSIINEQPDEYITLLAKWIDSSLADTDGLTALDHALKMNKPKVVEILARNFARLPAGFESLEKYMEKRNLHLTDQEDAAGKRIPFTSAQIKELSVAYKSGRTASIKSAEAVLVPTDLGKHSISSETDLEQEKTITTMRIDGPIMEIIAAYVGGHAFPDAPRT